MSISPLLVCDSCGNDEGPFVAVLKTLTNGEKVEVKACDDCRTHYEVVQLLRIRLDQFPYILNPWPPFWDNGVSLHGLFDGEQATLVGNLSLEDFPLMEDFEVVLEAFVRKHLLEKTTLQYKTKFFSPSYGYLAHFCNPYTTQDLCQEDFVIPCGTFDNPFIDFEQRWGESLLIAEDENFVYVLNHREMDGSIVCHFPAFRDYEHNIWFKVEKSRYYSQWEKAIRLCHTWRGKFQ